jgi:hypothetical protein
MKPLAQLEWMHPLIPGDCFLYQVNISSNSTDLPDIEELLDQERFAYVSLFWNEEGIGGTIRVQRPFEAAFFPDYAKGDAIEIFIDTRNNKKAGFASKFCHQFVLLPVEVEGVTAKEVTRFRSEDAHELCDPSYIEVRSIFLAKSYQVEFMIAKEALHGYDPILFPKLGFAYRIYKGRAKVQSFPFSCKSFEPLHHPSLWASLYLQ